MDNNNNNNGANVDVTDQNGTENGTTGTEDNNDGQQVQQQQQQTVQQSNEKQEKTFTQRQVNNMMAKEKRQGREAALRELGLDPANTQMMNLVKQLMDNLKPEGQVAAEQAAANQAAIEEANKKAVVAEAKAEAMMAGLKAEFVEDAVVLVLSKVDETTDVKAAIEELKTKYPVWFGEDDTSNDTNGNKSTVTITTNGTGTSVKGAKTKVSGGSAQKSLGERLATQRQNNAKAQKSFWD